MTVGGGFEQRRVVIGMDVRAGPKLPRGSGCVALGSSADETGVETGLYRVGECGAEAAKR